MNTFKEEELTGCSVFEWLGQGVCPGSNSGALCDII